MKSYTIIQLEDMLGHIYAGRADTNMLNELSEWINSRRGEAVAPPPTIKRIWEDCTIMFICPKCEIELLADSQSGEDECPSCGLKYQLVAYVKIGGG